MSDKTGSPGNPYTEGDYLALVQQGLWHGGWMLASNQGLVYITTDQSVEQHNDEGLLGSQENPFSRTAYNEMMLAETWPGGYVQFGHEPDTIE